MKRSRCFLLAFVFCAIVSGTAFSGDNSFTFVVTADMRDFTAGKYDNSQYFRGACEAIKKTGAGAFMISPGDIDPPEGVRTVIDEVMGKDYIWYPVVGNHDTGKSDMNWLRQYNADGKKLPDIVCPGPKGCVETTYSFNYKNAHFAILNEYFEGKSDTDGDGDVCDGLFQWLADDLKANQKYMIFVSGHVPMISEPDIDTKRLRHQEGSLNAHEKSYGRFSSLLRQYHVMAYICGHTHNTSFVSINGVWQLDAGHARGIGDTGVPSTFIRVLVDGNDVSAEFYRLDDKTGEYALKYTVNLSENSNQLKPQEK